MSGLMSGGWETGDCHSFSHRAHPRLYPMAYCCLWFIHPATAPSSSLSPHRPSRLINRFWFQPDRGFGQYAESTFLLRSAKVAPATTSAAPTKLLADRLLRPTSTRRNVEITGIKYERALS